MSRTVEMESVRRFISSIKENLCDFSERCGDNHIRIKKEQFEEIISLLENEGEKYYQKAEESVLQEFGNEKCINRKTGDCKWYHTTQSDRVDKILEEGLRINQATGFRSVDPRQIPVSFLWFKYIPYMESFGTVLEVDLSFLDLKDYELIEHNRKLKVLKDIPSEYIKVVSR